MLTQVAKPLVLTPEYILSLRLFLHCSVTNRKLSINVSANPLTISTTNINACEGQVVNLGNYVSINNLTLTPISYEWNNIGGNIIYGENPVTRYQQMLTQ